MKKTKIILIRHGESLANAQKIYLGHTDWDLSENGKKQAQIAAEYFKDEKIDAIYSSDLIRAYNTAVPHSQLHSLPINAREELREIHLGDWEGRYIDDLLRDFHDEFVYGWRDSFGVFQPPNGESVPHLAKRIRDAVIAIAEENEGKTILITTHAAAIRSFWGLVTETVAEEVAEKIPFPTNASATIVYYEDGRLIPGEFSVDHYQKKKLSAEA